MKPLHIIKIGGAVINDAQKFRECLDGIAQISEPCLIVHGGGRTVDAWLTKINHPIHMHDGRRITDDVTLEIAVMAYAGLTNKQIVSGLQARNVNGIGLTGADADAILATKRKPNPIDFGWVGDIQKVNHSIFEGLIEMQLTPVCCALTHDGQGQLLNTNADTIASAIAGSLSQRYDVQLWFAFDKKGVLMDVNDESSVLSRLTKASYAQLLVAGKIHDGMKPKLTNAFHALDHGVRSVHIFSSHMIGEIPHDQGTKITLT